MVGGGVAQVTLAAAVAQLNGASQLRRTVVDCGCPHDVARLWHVPNDGAPRKGALWLRPVPLLACGSSSAELLAGGTSTRIRHAVSWRICTVRTTHTLGANCWGRA